MASLVAQRLKRLLAMWETWVQSLGREDPLEKEMATHSRILAWRIPGTEEPGGLLSMGCTESDTTERLSLPSIFCYPVHGALSCENLWRVINTKICLFAIFFS